MAAWPSSGEIRQRRALFLVVSQHHPSYFTSKTCRCSISIFASPQIDQIQIYLVESMAEAYVSTATFTLPPNLAPFTAPLKTFLDSYNSESRLVVGGFIFSHGRPTQPLVQPLSNGEIEGSGRPSAALEPRLLLLHRASADAYGDLWDFAGGSCESSDATLIDAVKREVWEETGLRVSDAMEFVGLHTWFEDIKKGNSNWVKFSFLVTVDGDAETENGVDGETGFPRIKLAETEHQDFMWATERDIKASLNGEEGAMKFIAIEEIEIAAEAFKRFNQNVAVR